MNHPLAQFISSLLQAMDHGDLDRTELINAKGRLDPYFLRRHSKDSDNEIFHPVVYPLYRELKMRVEERVPFEEFDVARHQHLIDSLRCLLASDSSIQTTAELMKADSKLYTEITKTRQQLWIYWKAGLPRFRPNYIYWSDSQLLEQAANYSSCTQLKGEESALHRHLKARGLMSELVRHAPQYARFWYCGINGTPYDSIPELTVGNWFVESGVPHYSQYPIPPTCPRARPRTADFYLLECGTVLELEQSRDSGRGSRRAAYEQRAREKYQDYDSGGVPWIAVDSSSYFRSGGFDYENFARAVWQKCLDRGVRLPPPPPLAALAYQDNLEEKDFLGHGTSQEVLDYLEGRGIDHIAELQNKASGINKLILARTDGGGEVYRLLRGGSELRRQENRTRRKRKTEEHRGDVVGRITQLGLTQR